MTQPSEGGWPPPTQVVLVGYPRSPYLPPPQTGTYLLTFGTPGRHLGTLWAGVWLRFN